MKRKFIIPIIIGAVCIVVAIAAVLLNIFNKDNGQNLSITTKTQETTTELKTEEQAETTTETESETETETETEEATEVQEKVNKISTSKCQEQLQKALDKSKAQDNIASYRTYKILNDKRTSTNIIRKNGEDRIAYSCLTRGDSDTLETWCGKLGGEYVIFEKNVTEGVTTKEFDFISKEEWKTYLDVSTFEDITSIIDILNKHEDLDIYDITCRKYVKNDTRYKIELKMKDDYYEIDYVINVVVSNGLIKSVDYGVDANIMESTSESTTSVSYSYDYVDVALPSDIDTYVKKPDESEITKEVFESEYTQIVENGAAKNCVTLNISRLDEENTGCLYYNFSENIAYEYYDFDDYEVVVVYCKIDDEYLKFYDYISEEKSQKTYSVMTKEEFEDRISNDNAFIKLSSMFADDDVQFKKTEGENIVYDISGNAMFKKIVVSNGLISSMEYNEDLSGINGVVEYSYDRKEIEIPNKEDYELDSSTDDYIG